jgi:rRNA maturation RNase YbeY
MYRILITRQSRYPANTKKIKDAVKETLREHNVQNAEVSIALVGERKIRELSKTYLGEDDRYPLHEVLSFPAAEVKGEFVENSDLPHLGEILVCYPEARKMAMKRNRFVDDVIIELAQHSVLHLLGIHHE